MVCAICKDTYYYPAYEPEEPCRCGACQPQLDSALSRFAGLLWRANERGLFHAWLMLKTWPYLLERLY